METRRQPLSDVSSWLEAQGLVQYAELFAANAIDSEALPELTDQHLKELGLPLGHRIKLLKSIRELDPADTEATMRDASPAAPEHRTPGPGGERRQVTVLFADLADYTRLSNELDAEDVHNLMGRFFERVDAIVEEFGGAVDKHIGDCVMAVFGAPVAHGNDAERAARAALGIQHAMPELSKDLGLELEVHIGLASGQVVASGTGSSSHQEYTVTGDSVNLAARLTSQAQRGEILSSDAMRRLLPERFELAEAGELEVKGFAQAIRVWRLLGLEEKTPTAHRPFVGRHAEVAQFEGVLTTSLKTSNGQAVHVRGEAGIGKTRLVEEFKRKAEASGFASHLGLVLDFGADAGRDAVRSIVRSLFGLTWEAASAELRAAAERATSEGLIAVDHRPHLNDLLHLPQPVDLRAVYSAMDNAARNRGKRETVAELIERKSRDGPLLVLVEDIHWADQPTLDYLSTLTRTVAGCPAILVMTSRIEADPLDQAWRSRIGGSTFLTLDLGPLRKAETEELTGLYVDATADFARLCIERAAGNPLFLEQLLRHAEESAPTGVPGSVQSLVQARMDQLDPIDKRALQAASIFGQRFSLDGLRYLVQAPDYGCEGLMNRFLVRPQGADYLFAHALIQEGVYASILRSMRRDLHRRAAEWFSERDAALHAEHLDRAQDPRAAEAYMRAAQAQTASHRHEEALTMLNRGLEISRDKTVLYELFRLQGDLLRDLGDIEGAIKAFEQAADSAEKDEQTCQALIGLGSSMRDFDALDDALAILDKSKKIAVRHSLDRELAQIHHHRGNLYFPMGKIDACLQEHERSLQHARAAGSEEGEALALGGIGHANYQRGAMTTAGQNWGLCFERCRQHGFLRIEATHLHRYGLTLMYRNELEAAIENASAGAEMAARLGLARVELTARCAASYVLWELGNFAAAKEQSEHALQIARGLGNRRHEPMILYALVRSLASEGQRDAAIRLARDAISVSRDTGMTFAGPWILGALAIVTSNIKERQAALKEGEAVLAQGSVSHNYFWFYRDAVEASLESEDWDGAEKYATALQHYTRFEPLPWSDFFAARGLALAKYGKGSADQVVMSEISRLCEHGRGVGFKAAVPALESVVSSVRPSPVAF